MPRPFLFPNMPIEGFRDLAVWRKSVDLLEEVYRLSRRLPAEERFGITSQLRRSVVSVSSNIAEGSGRGTTPDFRNFLSIARGSVKETESLILVCVRLQFVSREDVRMALRLTDEVSRMLATFRESLLRRSKRD